MRNTEIGAFVDRGRASRLMREQGIDALVVLQPENFQYATGAPPGVAALFRRAGAAIAVIPADEAAPPAAIASDLFERAFRASSDIADLRTHPIWVEDVDVGSIAPGAIRDRMRAAHAASGRAPGFARPETFDQRLSFSLLAEALAARGLGDARLGVEFDFLPVADMTALRNALPHATFVDGADVIRRCRMIKSPREIALLREASELAEAGIVALKLAVKEGVRRETLSEAWRDGARAEATKRNVTNFTGLWDYVSVGPDPWGGGDVVRRGEPIKIDVGCVLAGYSSDGGRTMTFGRPNGDVAELHAALLGAFDAGLAAFRIGDPLRNVHAAVHRAMREAGFVDYARGHVGHSVGQSVFSEEWPFMSAACDLPLEAGMMLAFETPHYVKGVGGFIIEDQLLATLAGVEIINRLPRRLEELG